ncbi:hypothetical protein [Albidovulum sediminis]|uniref:Uncharacterized protein n=1 Tax=Albidovulum sediminis TaxID=3066345 RepID=A0ABT2NPF1_9RHOB|nr:hypothetical protein [Defluviimonas sediminis]MCT8330813.1 hypothetical protein [Defluviimonas sediminis]
MDADRARGSEKARKNVARAIGFLGSPKSTTGCFCDRSTGDANEVGFLDVDAAEPRTLIDGSDDAIMKALSASPKVIRAVAINKVPLLFAIAEPKPEHLRKVRIVADAPELMERVGKALASRFASAPEPASLPVEKQIYAEFYTDGEATLNVCD